MSYLLRSVIPPQCNVQYTGSLVPSLQTFTKLAKKAVIWHTKRALGALPFLPFLSQIAVTGDRLTESLNDERRLWKKEKGKKGDGGVTPQLKEVAEERKQGNELAVVCNMTSVQGESIFRFTVFSPQ